MEGSINIIEKGIDRTANITKVLDAYVRPNENELTLIDLNKSIDICLSLLNNNVTENIEIHKTLNKIPKVLCHPGDINQVIMNLLSNALDFIEENGKILIETNEADNKWVQVIIQDKGVGIEDENINKIFEPFYTTKDVGKGIGLGLTISYNIVKEHGGEIDVKSKMGEGSTFTLKLPINNIG